MDRYVGCFDIAYLTDHYHIGVKAKYAPQSSGKGNAGLGIDLNLIDVLKPIFGRVFNGNDVSPQGVKRVYAGI
ncbi:hypothetical protein ES708_06944 [subsurface metagenome]